MARSITEYALKFVPDGEELWNSEISFTRKETGSYYMYEICVSRVDDKNNAEQIRISDLSKNQLSQLRRLLDHCIDG